MKHDGLTKVSSMTALRHTPADYFLITACPTIVYSSFTTAACSVFIYHQMCQYLNQYLCSYLLLQVAVHILALRFRNRFFFFKENRVRKLKVPALTSATLLYKVYCLKRTLLLKKGYINPHSKLHHMNN